MLLQEHELNCVGYLILTELLENSSSKLAVQTPLFKNVEEEKNSILTVETMSLY